MANHTDMEPNYMLKYSHEYIACICIVKMFGPMTFIYRYTKQDNEKRWDNIAYVLLLNLFPLVLHYC